MSDGFQLIAIDDNRRLSYALEVQLRLVGEDPLMATSLNWQIKLDSNNIQSGKSKPIIVIGLRDALVIAGLIKNIHAINKTIPIIINSALCDENQYVETSRHLVLNLKQSPLNYQSLLSALDQARNLACGAITGENSEAWGSENVYYPLIGDSLPMENNRQLMHQVANKKTTVLILGGSGTGKEIMAKSLHYHSNRSDKPFMMVNCIAHNAERFATELFGLEGDNNISERRQGLFEKANQGTLFFDEIGDMPLSVQGKIMDFLERQEFVRIGGRLPISTDVRIIASSNQNLQTKIAEGKFRQDLFYRLSVIPMEIPLLRDRKEDIPALAAALSNRLMAQEQANDETGEKRNVASHNPMFNAAALISLQRHTWPGNVRELSNLIERLLITHPNMTIGVNELPTEYQHIDAHEIEHIDAASVQGNEIDLEVFSKQEKQMSIKQNFSSLDDESLNQYLQNFEKNIINIALNESQGALGFAAQRLQISEEELSEKMSLYQLVY